jgi:hypothetical protein
VDATCRLKAARIGAAFNVRSQVSIVGHASREVAVSIDVSLSRITEFCNFDR